MAREAKTANREVKIANTVQVKKIDEDNVFDDDDFGGAFGDGVHASKDSPTPTEQRVIDEEKKAAKDKTAKKDDKAELESEKDPGEKITFILPTKLLTNIDMAIVLDKKNKKNRKSFMTQMIDEYIKNHKLDQEPWWQK